VKRREEGEGVEALALEKNQRSSETRVGRSLEGMPLKGYQAGRYRELGKRHLRKRGEKRPWAFLHVKTGKAGEESGSGLKNRRRNSEGR